MCHACLATTALALLPASLGAEQLDLGMRSGISWNDNVYGTSQDAEVNGQPDEPVDDYSVRLSPYAEVSDPDGDLTWNVRYQPSFERYLSENDLSGLDQQASAGLSWRFAERWTVSLQEGYGIFQNPVRLNESSDPADPVALNFRNQEVTSNSTTAVLRHLLSPRDNVSLNLSYASYTYPNGGGNDRGTPTVALAYQHVLSERTSIGTRFSWIQQTYDRSGGTDQTRFYNLAGTLEHRFSPTFRLEASAGPTLIDSSPVEGFEVFQFGTAFRNIAPQGTPAQVIPVAIDATTCGQRVINGVPVNVASFNFAQPCRAVRNQNGAVVELDPDEITALSRLTVQPATIDEQGLPIEVSGSQGNDLTYFARLALIKDWESWRGELVYQRANSDSATFGSSSVADSLEGTLTWTPLRYWTFNLGAGISLEEQTADQLVPTEFVVANAPAPPGVTSVPQLAQVQSIIAKISGDAEKYQTQSVSFSASRQLTERSSVFTSVYWYTQRQDTALAGSGTARWDNLTLWVGIDWAFDPIRF